MDLDRYISSHESTWRELEALLPRARRRRGIDVAELDRFLQLYQRTTAHLAHVQGRYQDPALIGRLSRLVASSGAVLYGTRTSAIRSIGQFFATTFPEAVWRIRRFVLASAVATFLPAAVVGVWIANSDSARDAVAPDALREAYIEDDFEDYYSSEPAGTFATKVLVNNIQVSFFAFAAGAILCVGALVILVQNGAAVGFAAGLFHAAGQAPKFWGLILPHGLLELTAVTIAGGAGLCLGWSIIAPGDRTRAAAFAAEGRHVVPVVIGLMLVFIVADIIEGFVTPSSLPTIGRVGIGVVVELAFVTYIISRGSDADSRAAHIPRAGWSP